MTALDKATLKSNLNTNYPDNNENLITPLNDRTQHTDEIDSALNIIQAAIQTVIGEVDFTGGLKKNGGDVISLAGVSANDVPAVNSTGDDIVPSGFVRNPVSGAIDIVGKAFNTILFIKFEANFPVQDGSKITLQSGVFHWVIASFSTGKYFDFENNALITAGAQGTNTVVTYTGTGAMFRGTDVDFTVREMVVDHPSGEGYSFAGTGGTTSFGFIDNVTNISGTKYATFDNMVGVVINRSAAPDVDDGVSVIGANFGIYNHSTSLIKSTSATFKALDFGTAVVNTLEVENVNMDGPVGSIGISGLASSGNVGVNRLAMVDNCEFGDDITPLENITNTDVRWNFFGNNAIGDTIIDAMASLNGNATETVIAAVGVPVKIAGTWTIERESKFSVDTTGRMTLTSERAVTVPLDGTTTTEAASGTNKDIKTYFALNGSVISNSGKKSKVGASDPRNTSILWQLELQPGDFIEEFQENNSDTTNLITEDAIIRAR